MQRVRGEQAQGDRREFLAGLYDLCRLDGLTELRDQLRAICRRLNEEHAAAVEFEIRTGDWKTARTRGRRGPTRYKLGKGGVEGLLPGLT